MTHSPTRILSDLHFGEHSSRVRSLTQLGPLLTDIGGLVLNGDSLETRPGAFSAEHHGRREMLESFLRSVPVTFITGNHDPDISPQHLLELAGGRILLTHGDLAFDNIVPWSLDASLAGQLVAKERLVAATGTLDDLLAAHRRAAFALPRRHRAEPPAWQYLSGLLTDTIWPLLQIARVLRAWSEIPARIAALARMHRPRAKFILVGHSHRPGVWRQPDGRVVINTGSLCRPLGALMVDIGADHLVVRKLSRRQHDFHPGETVVEFALDPA